MEDILPRHREHGLLKEQRRLMKLHCGDGDLSDLIFHPIFFHQPLRWPQVAHSYNQKLENALSASTEADWCFEESVIANLNPIKAAPLSSNEHAQDVDYVGLFPLMVRVILLSRERLVAGGVTGLHIILTRISTCQFKIIC